jgi:Peptidase family M41
MGKLAVRAGPGPRAVLGAVRGVVLTAEDRERTAFHESGHALLGMLRPGADPVRKISIIPRGRALGVTYQSPQADRYSYSARYLRGRITGALGGRAAEELVYGTSPPVPGTTWSMPAPSPGSWTAKRWMKTMPMRQRESSVVRPRPRSRVARWRARFPQCQPRQRRRRQRSEASGEVTGRPRILARASARTAAGSSLVAGCRHAIKRSGRTRMAPSREIPR